MKNYLFIYSDELGGKEDLSQLLNNIDSIEDWRSDIPNSFYIKSEIDSHTLFTCIKYEIEKFYGKNNLAATRRLFITEIPENCDGLITKETWDFLLQNPEPINNEKAESYF